MLNFENRFLSYFKVMPASRIKFGFQLRLIRVRVFCEVFEQPQSEAHGDFLSKDLIFSQICLPIKIAAPATIKITIAVCMSI